MHVREIFQMNLSQFLSRIVSIAIWCNAAWSNTTKGYFDVVDNPTTIQDPTYEEDNDTICKHMKDESSVEKLEHKERHEEIG